VIRKTRNKRDAADWVWKRCSRLGLEEIQQTGFGNQMVISSANLLSALAEVED
jgi:hypothetical protein